MAILARTLLVLGVCLGAIGAAGFGEEIERGAWPLFLSGIVASLIGGLLLRRALRRRIEEGEGGNLTREGLATALAAIAEEVVRLDDERESLDGETFCRRIDTLLTGACFELGSRNEDYARLLGPSAFAGIWEGFAVSERLLARAWSIATDGHLEEAREELSRARAPIVSAAERAG
jgi:hypothetical protein